MSAAEKLSPKVQTEIMRRWPLLSTETLGELADLEEYRRQFLRLFGFGIDGIDYAADVDPKNGFVMKFYRWKKDTAR